MFIVLLQGKYDETIKECTKALELNPSYLKALLRRAEAHEKLEHYEEAIAGQFELLHMSVDSFVLNRLAHLLCSFLANDLLFISCEKFSNKLFIMAPYLTCYQILMQI